MEPEIIPVEEKTKDNARAAIVASTLVVMTCILSCAAVLIVLILHQP